MTVFFEDEVLQHESDWKDLDQIVALFIQERHRYDFLGDNDCRVLESPWLASEAGRWGRQNIEFFEKGFTETLYPANGLAHSIRISVTLTSNQTDRLRSPEALSCLRAPALIALEDAASDRTFLEAMIQAFERLLVKEALLQGWLKVEHLGGGGGLKAFLERTKNGVPGPTRTLVVLDSDRRYPEEEPQKLAEARATAKNVGAALFILRHREMENYITTPLLWSLGNIKRKQTRLRAVGRLSLSQRAHFDFKLGLPKQPCPEEGILFAGLDKDTREQLGQGFGDKVWHAYRDHSDKLMAGDVRALCHREPNEIDQLLDRMEELL